LQFSNHFSKRCMPVSRRGDSLLILTVNSMPKGGDNTMTYSKPEMFEIGNAEVLIQGMRQHTNENGGLSSSGSYEVDE
jgi:hypothetical protein